MFDRGYTLYSWSSILAVVLGTAACGGGTKTSEHATPTATATTTADDPDAKLAPFPYTAAEIRAASKAGRKLTFVVEQPGKPSVRKVLSFMVADDERATIVSEILDNEGKTVGDPESSSETWEELRRHASYPRSATTVVEMSTETPAGAFTCKQYTVVEKTETVERRMVLCFAKELPGPPVEMTVEENGELVLSMTLLKNEAGLDP